MPTLQAEVKVKMRKTAQKLYPSGEYATAPGKYTFSMIERPM